MRPTPRVPKVARLRARLRRGTAKHAKLLYLFLYLFLYLLVFLYLSFQVLQFSGFRYSSEDAEVRSLMFATANPSFGGSDVGSQN